MKKKISKKNRKNFFIAYGFHIFLIFFLVNILTAYVFRYYIFGQSCMTRLQVQNDNRCLYILGDLIFNKGTRSMPHHDHPCGTDVTAVVPPTHISTPALYLLPNQVANLCVAITSTPTPKPSPTPSPKPTPIKSGSTVTPNPTKTVATSTPIQSTPTVPYVTAPVSVIPQNVPRIALSLSLSGVTLPLHPVRQATIYIYNSAQNLSDKSTQPIQTAIVPVTFDATVTSPTQGLFLNTSVSITTLSPGKYQFIIGVPGYIKKQLKYGQITQFTLLPGNITVLLQATLLTGDIDGNNSVDIADYNALLRCYGDNAMTSTCNNPVIADLNDDGRIDAIDYNIFLSNFRAYRELSITPTRIAVSPTATPIKSEPTIATKPTSAPISRVITPSVKKPQKLTILTAGVALTKILDWLLFLIVCITVMIGIMRSSFVAKFMKKNEGPVAQKSVPPLSQKPTSSSTASVMSPSQSIQQSDTQDTIDHMYYIKPIKSDGNATGTWVMLVDGDKMFEGYSTNPVQAGFARVKGVKKKAKEQTYIAISEIIPIKK